MTEQQHASESAAPRCPKCTGEMWDNRQGKRNPRAPDFKCKDRSCDGVIWPPRDASAPAAAPAQAAGTADDPACPVCGGRMWDDRATKRNPRAPDFKCRNKPKVMGGPGCPGVIWPPREGERRPAAAPAGGANGQPRAAAPRNAPPAPRNAAPAPRSQRAAPTPPPFDDVPPPDDRDFTGDDDLPF